MTRAQALKEARKRWGNRAVVRFNPKGATEQERQAAKDKRFAMRADGPKHHDREWKTENDRLLGICLSHRYEVGYLGPDWLPYFGVQGSGDSWELAFKNADRLTRK